MQCCGQSNTPDEEARQGQRIDFLKVMSQGSFRLNCSDFLHLSRVEKNCIDEVKRVGQLTDAFMDSQKIVRMEGDTAEFADKVYYQQHAHCISHEHSLARYVDYRQMKFDASDPVKKQKAAELAKAQKLIEKNQKAEEKKSETARKKREREAMDPDELAQIKLTEKMARKAKTELTAQRKAEELAAAEALIATLAEV